MRAGRNRQTYSTRTGLPSDYAGQIVLDLNNDLWISTGLGLAKTDLDGENVLVFDERDGLPSNELYFASLPDRSGRVFFGGHSGLVSFHPDSCGKRNSFHRFTSPTSHFGCIPGGGPGFPCGNRSNSPRTPGLGPQQNDISLTFAALDYAHPERNRYRYRLEPQDGLAEAADLDAAHYTNLDPGTYTFSVMGSNSDGIWNETPTILSIIIAPPWYRTCWAYSSMLWTIVIFVVVAVPACNRERMRMALEMERAEGRTCRISTSSNRGSSPTSLMNSAPP